MLPGFNHNVRHGGKTYHLQTEDLGTSVAAIATHLFCGGNVIASARSDYRALLGDPELERRVRALMEEQHKQVLRQLIGGAWDEGQTG